MSSPRSSALWLNLGAYENLCRTSHDAFDAELAALTARTADLGLTLAPSAEQQETAPPRWLDRAANHPAQQARLPRRCAWRARRLAVMLLLASLGGTG